MALPLRTTLFTPCVFRLGTRPRSKPAQILIQLSICFSIACAAHAQAPEQQYVYGSEPVSSTSSVIPGLAKNGQTGALSILPGSPFNERLEGSLMAIDGHGKFLFVLNPKSNDISMFQIDQASGALSEVSGSPFQVPPTVNPNMAPSQPLSIATEQSGKFLFVGYLSGDFLGQSSVVSLAINTSGSSPGLLTQQSIPTASLGAPAQLLTDPKGLHLYVGLTHGQNTVSVGGAEVYSIDPATGKLGYQGMADMLNADGLSYAIDPGDRFFYAGGHGNTGPVESCVISPVNGTAGTCQQVFFLGLGDFPSAMLAESSGHFLYIAQVGGAEVYSIDQATGALTPALGPLNGIFLNQGTSVADPMGPYIYSVAPGSTAGIHAYQVDQRTGNLSEISGSPFSIGVAPLGCCVGIALLGNSAQAVSGPAVSIFPSAAAPFGATVGSTSPTQVFSIVNVGSQSLAINSISIGGANASSFSQSNTCPATLAPQNNCSVSITFAPSSAGPFTANLLVADNAPGSPQTLALNGTGSAAVPAVTFSPATPSFPATNQGSSSAPQTLTAISSGNAPLQVSSVSLTGPNPTEFSVTNNCTSPVAPSANCTISLVFSPTTPGQRTASLAISDNVPGSPQTIALSGTGIATVPAVTFSPATLSFPATTQGTSGAAQTLKLTNSGIAPLHISSVALGGSNSSEFSVTNTCTALLAPAANCTISLVFSPLGTGSRTASLTISDDAPGSPQTLSFSATANPAISPGTAPNGSTSATVSAGQSAQYQLQLTPGPGFSGTVSLSCSGAPLGAVCQVPATLSLANGAPTPLNVTVTTSGSGILPPSHPVRLLPNSRVPLLPLLPLVAFALLLLISFFAFRPFESPSGRNRLASCGVLSAALFCAFVSAAGCGGGSSSAAIPPLSAPPPVVTPSGTSTITITLAATSSSGQPLQLQPMQLTLTVK
jgi:6-phosphogluconolactonase (cycloisomerase 2 family)